MDTDPGAGRVEELSSADLDTSSWHTASVPGDVNAIMVRDRRMPDPRFGDNGRQCYWVTSREWWYRLLFDAPESAQFPHADLCMDGIDGHADVYLNGFKIAHAENAFRPYRIDVCDKLNPDSPNILLVRFHSIDEIMGGPRLDELGGWYSRRTFVRKPQFCFGWDWSLPLPSIGLSRPVRLELHHGPRLIDTSIKPFISGRLDFKFKVSTSARDAGYHLLLRVSGHGTNIEEKIEPPGRVRSYTTIEVPDPRLWWPNGMGAQNLYDYEVLLVVNGEVEDRRAGRIGIREVRVVEDPFTPEAGPGISMWFEINGKRVFCKGANWVPPELWPAAATPDQYRFYIEKAAEANFNMLRVWGGGAVEPDIFYDLCDELGILVWQDFMFASGGYPVDLLRHEIIAEAEHMVTRLRNHPCIAIWCGCNEDVYSWSLPDEKSMMMADTGVYSQTTGGYEVDRLRDDPQIYSMILRGTVSRLGLGVPYTESSPQSYDDAGNMPESGNSHISCWKYALFGTSRSGMFNDEMLSKYNSGEHPNLFESDSEPERFMEHFEKVCSFDSEFCIQGPCDEWAFRQFLPTEHLWPPDDMWIYHIQRGHARIPHHEQTLFIAGAIFGKIDSLQKYVKHGQATHAEMMRAEFESARRDRPNNGGAMVWMLNDCWPTSNWSIIDYYRRPKPSYYAAKRACATHLPIVFARNGRVEFFFSNDGPQPCKVELSFGQERLDGTRVWTKQGAFMVEETATHCFYAIDRSRLDVLDGDYLFIDTVADGRSLARVTCFVNPWKDMKWPMPNIGHGVISQEKTADGWLSTVQVKTEGYARFCHLVLAEEKRPFRLDDNFFDLCNEDCRIVTIRSQEKLSSGDIRVGHWHTNWV